MFLKSLEIFGFKSFADRCRIEFQGGISALLGPNGCGKSNVVDAIKWVIGEQSVKSLRAEKMEDIIFNGSEDRKPLNVAEVTIVISNDQGLLPLEMPEIAVKRRLYRSGESEYFINNTPVRLREVRELFFDTGIGKSAYSVMEQGRIDQILSSKPEERRYIFEEAAGITKYKIKGAEAEKKLERTEENMKQIDGILGEVRRSYNSLKIQAEKTQKYKDLREKAFSFDLDIQLLRLRNYLEQKNESEKKQEELTKKRDGLQTEIDKVNQFLKNNLDLVNTMETSLVETQKKIYQAGLEKSSAQNKQDILNERISEVKRQEAACREKARDLDQRIANLKEQILDKENTLGEFARRIGETDKNIGEFDARVKSAQERIRRNEEEIRRQENRSRELEKQLLELQKGLDALTEDIVGQLDSGLKAIGYSHQARLTAENDMDDGLRQLLIQIDGKIRLLHDGISLESLDKKDLLQMLTTGKNALEELRTAALELENRFGAYKTALPTFLDDFLAPEGIITQKRNIDNQIKDVRLQIEENRKTVAALTAENRELREKIEEYRKTLEDLRVNRMQLVTQKTAMEEAIQLLRRDLKNQELLSIENQSQLENSLQQVKRFSGELEKLKEDVKVLAEKEKTLNAEMASLQEGITKKHKDLIVKEKNQLNLSGDLNRIQEQLSKVQIALASQNTDIRNLYDNFTEKYSRDLGEFDSRIYEIRSSAGELKEKLASLRDEEKALGQINLMAPEEFAEVKERFDFLNNQLEDLKKGREDLVKITSQIRKESTDLFIETYDKIRKNFHAMFRRLFGGGRAELKLMEPNEILTTGIEIYAQPPGKNLENIALLSGGEKSLTAVALLFATYMVKPSPFCILDEIDAALDDQNIGRFSSLLMEFGDKSQFIIITHNKKTVTAARTLLGVTMEESGVSKLVSLRLDGNKEKEEEEELLKA